MTYLFGLLLRSRFRILITSETASYCVVVLNSVQTVELCAELESLLDHYSKFDGIKSSLEDHMDRVESSLIKFTVCGDGKALADQIASLKVSLQGLRGVVSADWSCHITDTNRSAVFDMHSALSFTNNVCVLMYFEALVCTHKCHSPS